MLAKVQKWGNSQGIRIPKHLLEHSQIKIGQEVDLTVQEGKIIVEPIHKIRGKYDINELAGRMPQQGSLVEEDWGTPVGREEW